MSRGDVSQDGRGETTAAAIPFAPAARYDRGHQVTRLTAGHARLVRPGSERRERAVGPGRLHRLSK
jgi:hypothetical protein